MDFMRCVHACVFLPCRCVAGSSIDSECAFEGDYDVPPLSMAEGLQHMRIMEGVSRSLPSSPLLTHQTVNVRLQPVKKISAGSATGTQRANTRPPAVRVHSLLLNSILYKAGVSLEAAFKLL